MFPLKSVCLEPHLTLLFIAFENSQSGLWNQKTKLSAYTNLFYQFWSREERDGIGEEFNWSSGRRAYDKSGHWNTVSSRNREKQGEGLKLFLAQVTKCPTNRGSSYMDIYCVLKVEISDLRFAWAA